MKPVRRPLKIVSTCLAVLIFAQAAFAHKPEVNFWKERAAAARQTFRTTPSIPAPKAQKTTLESFGSIRKLNAGTIPDNGFLLHIQDVHSNQEAQKNIAGALQALIRDGRVDLVALEGAFSPVELGVFRDFPDQDAIRRAADKLLAENQITGPIQALLSLDGRLALPPIVGVDDAGHYAANVQAVRDAAFAREREKKINAAQARMAERQKEIFLNERLRAFDRVVQKYRAEEIELKEYVSELESRTTALPINVRKLIEAVRLEGTLNEAELEKERTRLIATLVRRLSEKETGLLTTRVAAFRAGAISHARFYDELKKLCEMKGLSFLKFPRLGDYLRYVLLSDSIDGERLLNELQALEARVYEQLSRTNKERALLKKSRRLFLTKKLIDFALTKAEWAEYAASGAPLKPFDAFYREAEIRDQKIAENLTAAVAKYNAKNVVLIAGGFHSEGIKNGVGFSYASFTPKIARVETKSGLEHLSIFTREKTPLEKLFAGEKLFLSQPPMSEAAKARLSVSAVADSAVHLLVAASWLERVNGWTSVVVKRLAAGAIKISGLINGKAFRLRVHETQIESDGAIAGALYPLAKKFGVRVAGFIETFLYNGIFLYYSIIFNYIAAGSPSSFPLTSDLYNVLNPPSLFALGATFMFIMALHAYYGVSTGNGKHYPVITFPETLLASTKGSLIAMGGFIPMLFLPFEQVEPGHALPIGGILMLVGALIHAFSNSLPGRKWMVGPDHRTEIKPKDPLNLLFSFVIAIVVFVATAQVLYFMGNSYEVEYHLVAGMAGIGAAATGVAAMLARWAKRPIKKTLAAILMATLLGTSAGFTAVINDAQTRSFVPAPLDTEGKTIDYDIYDLPGYPMVVRFKPGETTAVMEVDMTAGRNVDMTTSFIDKYHNRALLKAEVVEGDATILIEKPNGERVPFNADFSWIWKKELESIKLIFKTSKPGSEVVFKLYAATQLAKTDRLALTLVGALAMMMSAAFGSMFTSLMRKIHAKQKPMGVFLADAPANEQTVGQIKELLAQFGKRTVLVGETGAGSDKEKLRRILETDKPAIIVVRSDTKAFKEEEYIALAAKNGVKTIVRAGAGVDNINVEAAEKYGIQVQRTHGNANSVANLTLRFLLAALEKQSGVMIRADMTDLAETDGWKEVFDLPVLQFKAALAESMKKGRGEISAEAFDAIFHAVSAEKAATLFKSLDGKTIGILGAGPIGELVAEKLEAIKKLTGAEFNIKIASRSRGDINTLVKEADVLSLHLPVTENTEGMINGKSLEGSRVKIILNTARQDLVTAAIFDGSFTYYADVDHSPITKLISEKYPGHAYFIPHIGASTADAAEGVEEKTLEVLEGILRRLTKIEPRAPNWIEKALIKSDAEAAAVPGFEPGPMAYVSDRLLIDKSELKEKLKRAVFTFDIDKTLALREQAMSAEMIATLRELMKASHFIVILTGSPMVEKRARIFDALTMDTDANGNKTRLPYAGNLIAITSEGTTIHHYDSQGREYIVANEFSRQETYSNVQFAHAKKLLDPLIAQIPEGEVVLSLTNRENTQMVAKLKGVASDVRARYALEFEQILNKEFRGEGIEFRGMISGETTITLRPVMPARASVLAKFLRYVPRRFLNVSGYRHALRARFPSRVSTKAEGFRFLIHEFKRQGIHWDLSNVLFFGDAFETEGNDRPVYDAPDLRRVKVYSVGKNDFAPPARPRSYRIGTSPDDTLAFLKKFTKGTISRAPPPASLLYLYLISKWGSPKQTMAVKTAGLVGMIVEGAVAVGLYTNVGWWAAALYLAALSAAHIFFEINTSIPPVDHGVMPASFFILQFYISLPYFFGASPAIGLIPHFLYDLFIFWLATPEKPKPQPLSEAEDAALADESENPEKYVPSFMVGAETDHWVEFVSTLFNQGVSAEKIQGVVNVLEQSWESENSKPYVEEALRHIRSAHRGTMPALAKVLIDRPAFDIAQSLTQPEIYTAASQLADLMAIASGHPDPWIIGTKQFATQAANYSIAMPMAFWEGGEYEDIGDHIVVFLEEYMALLPAAEKFAVSLRGFDALHFHPEQVSMFAFDDQPRDVHHLERELKKVPIIDITAKRPGIGNATLSAPLPVVLSGSLRPLLIKLAERKLVQTNILRVFIGEIHAAVREARIDPDMKNTPRSLNYVARKVERRLIQALAQIDHLTEKDIPEHGLDEAVFELNWAQDAEIEFFSMAALDEIAGEHHWGHSVYDRLIGVWNTSFDMDRHRPDNGRNGHVQPAVIAALALIGAAAAMVFAGNGRELMYVLTAWSFGLAMVLSSGQMAFFDNNGEGLKRFAQFLEDYLGLAEPDAGKKSGSRRLLTLEFKHNEHSSAMKKGAEKALSESILPGPFVHLGPIRYLPDIVPFSSKVSDVFVVGFPETIESIKVREAAELNRIHFLEIDPTPWLDRLRERVRQSSNLYVLGKDLRNFIQADAVLEVLRIPDEIIGRAAVVNSAYLIDALFQYAEKDIFAAVKKHFGDELDQDEYAAFEDDLKDHFGRLHVDIVSKLVRPGGRVHMVERYERLAYGDGHFMTIRMPENKNVYFQSSVFDPFQLQNEKRRRAYGNGSRRGIGSLELLVAMTLPGLFAAAWLDPEALAIALSATAMAGIFPWRRTKTPLAVQKFKEWMKNNKNVLLGSKRLIHAEMEFAMFKGYLYNADVRDYLRAHRRERVWLTRILKNLYAYFAEVDEAEYSRETLLLLAFYGDGSAPGFLMKELDLIGADKLHPHLSADETKDMFADALKEMNVHSPKLKAYKAMGKRIQALLAARRKLKPAQEEQRHRIDSLLNQYAYVIGRLNEPSFAPLLKGMTGDQFPWWVKDAANKALGVKPAQSWLGDPPYINLIIDLVSMEGVRDAGRMIQELLERRVSDENTVHKNNVLKNTARVFGELRSSSRRNRTTRLRAAQAAMEVAIIGFPGLIGDLIRLARYTPVSDLSENRLRRALDRLAPMMGLDPKDVKLHFYTRENWREQRLGFVFIPTKTIYFSLEVLRDAIDKAFSGWRPLYNDAGQLQDYGAQRVALHELLHIVGFDEDDVARLSLSSDELLPAPEKRTSIDHILKMARQRAFQENIQPAKDLFAKMSAKPSTRREARRGASVIEVPAAIAATVLFILGIYSFIDLQTLAKLAYVLPLVGMAHGHWDPKVIEFVKWLKFIITNRPSRTIHETQAQLAEIFGINETYVGRLLKKYGITRESAAAFRLHEWAKLRYKWRVPDSARSVAAAFGVSRWKAAEIFREFSIESVKNVERLNRIPAVKIAQSLTKKELAKTVDDLSLELQLPIAQMKAMEAEFIRQMRLGNGTYIAGKESLNNFETYAQMPSGKEQGRYIAVNWGGTNVTVYLVDLKGGGDYKVVKKMDKIKLTAAHRKDPRSVFDLIAKNVKALIDNDTENDYKIGFVYGFPLEQKAINSGIAARWSKGFKDAKGRPVLGQDVAGLLNHSLDNAGLPRVKVSALMNDTLNPMIVLAYQLYGQGKKSLKVIIGSIVGTGTNDAALFDQSIGLRNLEAGNFDFGGDKLLRRLWLEVDRELDKQEKDPPSGKQVLEKMVSGKYLGEVARRLSFAIIPSRALSAFKEPYSFTGEHLSMIENDKSEELVEVAKILGKKTTVEERRALKHLANMVVRRSAVINATKYAAIVKEIDKGVNGRYAIAIEGSVAEKYPHYLDYMRDTLSTMGLNKPNGASVNLMTVPNAQGVGAAILAATMAGHPDALGATQQELFPADEAAEGNTAQFAALSDKINNLLRATAFKLGVGQKTAVIRVSAPNAPILATINGHTHRFKNNFNGVETLSDLLRVNAVKKVQLFIAVQAADSFDRAPVDSFLLDEEKEQRISLSSYVTWGDLMRISRAMFGRLTSLSTQIQNAILALKHA